MLRHITEVTALTDGQTGHRDRQEGRLKEYGGWEEASKAFFFPKINDGFLWKNIENLHVQNSSFPT